MAITPQKVPQNDIIRQVKQTVDHNADLMLVSGEATDAGFVLQTSGGTESIPVDLSTTFVTRAEYEEGNDVPPASESESGRIPIVSDTEAQALQDDSKAMTAKKTLIALVKLGIVTINSDGSLTVNLGGPSNLNLDDVIENGDETNNPPYFFGGLFATLLPPPANKALLNVLVDPDNGKFYKAEEVGGVYEWEIVEIYEETALPPSLTIELSNSNFVPDETNNFRIVGPALIVEGASAQYGVERQLSDGTWIPYAGSIGWNANGLPAGCSIGSVSGFVTIGDNTVSADTDIAIRAAIFDFVLEKAATISNTAPAITGYRITGGTTLNEGSTSDLYFVVIDYSDGSSFIYNGPGTWSLPSDTTNSVVNSPTNYSTSLTSPVNSVPANTDLTLRFTFGIPGGGIIGKQVTIVNGACSTTMQTQSQLDTLPSLPIWEYFAVGIPYGGLADTQRAFASRAEAIAHLSTNDSSSKARSETSHATTSACAVGNALYGDNRPEHITAGTSKFYPVEAGFWGLDRKLPSVGVAGSFVVLETNACGEIVGRETVPLPAIQPTVSKFAMQIVGIHGGSGSYYDVNLLYKTNLPVGTQLEDYWPENWAVFGQTPEWLVSGVVDNPSAFPSGYEDYNVFMSYLVPISLMSGHSTQHIKIRKKDTTTLLLDTTFDPYGMANGQTKQFIPA